MRHLLIGCSICFLLTACSTSSSTQVITTTEESELTHTSGDPYAECRSETAEAVTREANQARDDKDLHPLHCAPELAKIAQAHADDMCDKNYLSHASKDGRTMVDRADNAGFDFMTLGENVAMGQRSPEQVHAGWMDSKMHRQNILNEDFSRLGVGYAPCGGSPYWVQVFAN
ncbi:MAG: CAP domain-containing protein [Myxococcota bacterium]